MKKVKALIMINLLFLSFYLYSLPAYSNPLITQVRKDGEIYLVEDYYRFKNIEGSTVGLALTGGGAKGLFNIGVIKALEEEKIPIDVIVGTSMGSIIATMYGSGLSIEQIEDIVTQAPFSKMFDFNLASNESILNTAKVNKFVEKVVNSKRLDQFPIPTALLSIELTSGNKYLTTTGRISKVLQGSYAIPYYFPIQRVKGKVFADPGIVENSPAKAATVLDADFVIATTYKGEISDNNYDTPGEIAARYMKLVQESNTYKILSKYSDIAIESDVVDYSFMDFSKADKLIDIGYRTTKRMIPEIKEKLEAKNIKLRNYKKREKLDLNQEIKDLKYDRMLIEELSYNPICYYGQDYSFFKHDLIRSSLYKFQYGMNLDKNHFNLTVLSTAEDNKDDVELKLRFRKLSKDIDLITKYKLNEDKDDDFMAGLRYYGDDYILGIGRGIINDQNFNYLKSKYKLGISSFLLEGESDILYPFKDEELKILISQTGEYKLNDNWILQPKLVFNNTNIMESPIIYRGESPNDFVKLQLSLNFTYNHTFINIIDFMRIFRLTDIQAYLFSDYQKDDSSSIALGIGSKADFKLLGLKPLDLEVYGGYDKEVKDIKFGMNICYDF
ncbi:patatin-like phospholipase family protein [Orenia marismortui]|uniref:NTE family protein n=1 Tax=Orenia marismortui TaxID=46469 RepID=A0A4R8GZ86_9FIRM|nr:patatin-like phospholipase family protein [Orenia marismortui]TDX51947.1 NTE family protein [Orenia marismortui]